MFDEFNADDLGEGEEGGLGLAGDLQESEVLLAGALGGELFDGVLDADAFRRVFGSTVLVARLQPGHDLILEYGQRPDSQDEERDAAGQ